MSTGAYNEDGRVAPDVAAKFEERSLEGQTWADLRAAAAAPELLEPDNMPAAEDELGDDYKPVDVYAHTEALVRSWGVEADRRHGHMRLLLPYTDADGKLRTHELMLDEQDAQELIDALHVGMYHLETGARPTWRTA